MCILKYVHESLFQFIYTYNVYFLCRRVTNNDERRRSKGNVPIHVQYTCIRVHVHVELFIIFLRTVPVSWPMMEKSYQYTHLYN